jgi:Brp/Blh family beta-carotene 15,15'-monooxygenase
MSSVPAHRLSVTPSTDDGPPAARVDGCGIEWLEQALDRHALGLVLGLLIAAAGWAATGGMGPGLTLGVVAVLIAGLGLPHGAFDMEVGRRLFSARYGRAWWPRFVGLYLVAAAAVVGWWWVHPVSALISLLALGIVHFGDEDLGPESDGVAGARRLLRAVSRGTVPVLAPLAFWSAEVAAIFGVLLGAGRGDGALVTGLADPQFVRTVGLVGLALGLPGLLDAAFAGGGRRRMPLVEPAAVALAAALMPPVVFFAAYFCFVHAVRHSLRSAAEMTPSDLASAVRGFVRVTWPATAATVVGAIAIGVWLVAGSGLAADDAVLRVVFIGLHALTVPHVLLALAERRAARHGGSP